MKESRLEAIIERLKAMTHTQADQEVRRFEREGQERALVTYTPATGLYQLTNRLNGETFEFDNLDLTAMEIFEALA